MIATSRPRETWQGSQCGRNWCARIAAVTDGQEPVNPSSTSVDAHKCGSSASRTRQYSTNGSISVGWVRRRWPGSRSPDSYADRFAEIWRRRTADTL